MKVCHFIPVNAAGIDESVVAPEVEPIAQRHLRFWMEACDAFRTWERREIYLSEPTEKTLAAYREDLKWMLRAGRMLHALVSDPDFPAPRFAAEIGGRLIQLQESWEALNNPMTEAEAEELIARHFPDEPRA